MILRKAAIRHGRILTATPTKTWMRCLATEVDLQDSVGGIEAELEHSLRQTKSIESEAQSQKIQYVPQIDARTLATQNLQKDGTAIAFQHHQRQQKLNKPLGTTISPHYQPHRLVTDPPRPSEITLELLLASQAHLGHKTSHWNPANSRYIFGIRQGIHIISLDVTAAHLRRACRVVSGVTERGGLVLFVGNRPGQERCVVRAAEMAEGCHLFERWTPGSITNGHQILRACRMKVVDEFDRTIPGYGKELADLPALKPDLVVCLNPLENWVMLHECGLNAIPTIGIIDTDANPTWVTYPIPANDDSLRCVQVIAGVLGRAGEEGQQIRRERALQGDIPYTPTDLRGGDDSGKRQVISSKAGRASGQGPAASGGQSRAQEEEIY
ncbi:MAG: hypothetical protein Q9163_001628 [Psora crenata]